MGGQEAPEQVYAVAAELHGYGESRVVTVRADQTLADLHRALLEAFSWADGPQYSFWSDDGVEYSPPSALRRSPFRNGDPYAQAGLVRRDAEKQTVGNLGLVDGAEIAYMLDYDTEWCATLTFRRAGAAAP